MIFAAGLGTRLGSLTQSVPKALVEVGGEPMLKRVLLNVKKAGIRNVVINVHYLADQIVEYLKINTNLGLNISISDESSYLLDTGGGLLEAENLFENDEPILLHNADIMTDLNLGEMIESHSKSGADVTLLVAQRPTSRYLLFDKSNRMIGWENIKSGELRSPYPMADFTDANRLAFGGIHIVEPKIFNYLKEYSPGEKKFSITPFYTKYCDRLKIKGYNPHGYKWIDIGKPESLIEAQKIAATL